MSLVEIITTIISTVAVVVAILSMLYSWRNDKFYRGIETARRKEEIEKREEEKETLRKEKYSLRPQLQTVFCEVGKKNNKEENYDIDIFFLPYKSLKADERNFSPLYREGRTGFASFNADGKKGRKHPICEYHDVYDKKEEWISKIIHLKNVGKTNIDSFYLLTTMEKYGSLVNNKYEDDIKVLEMYKCCEFKVTHYEHVMVGGEIKIKVSYPKGCTFEPVSFEIYMHAEDGSLWRQGLYHYKEEIIESSLVSSDEYYAYLRGEYLDAVMYDRAYWGQVNNRNRKDSK